MKTIMKVYDSCKIAIRFCFFGFVLIAVGFLLQNESVNVFYTFKGTFILLFSETLLKLGSAIIYNLPLIFMLNITCKKANSGYPVCLAFAGYLSFLIATMLLSSNNLASTAYSTSTGLNSIINMNFGTKYPLETGLIGSFIVAYITRISYVRSRHSSSYALLGFLHKDTMGLVYNIVFCFIAGAIVAGIWTSLFTYLQTLITYISKDLMDPLRIFIYGIADRVLNIIGLGSLIRQPFWYTALGGSYQTISGQTIIGDVNIWSYVKNLSSSTFIGSGRFITPYYVINMFLVPAIYFGFVFSISNKDEKSKLIMPCIGGVVLSIICGNPLPIEFVMLFTSPLLLLFYLLVVGGIFFYFSKVGVYLGSNLLANSTITAMPGNFPDFIINLRNIAYSGTLIRIIIVGILSFALMFVFTILYLRYLSYDVLRVGKTDEVATKIIDACGGKENVVNSSAGLFKICLKLNDLEKYNLDALKSLEVRRVSETKVGIDIECGTSSIIVNNKINEKLSHKHY